MAFSTVKEKVTWHLARPATINLGSAVMTEDTLPDLYLSGNAHLITEAIEELHGWPDLHPDVLAALLELPDRLVDLTKAWLW